MQFILVFLFCSRILFFRYNEIRERHTDRQTDGQADRGKNKQRIAYKRRRSKRKEGGALGGGNYEAHRGHFFSRPDTLDVTYVGRPCSSHPHLTHSLQLPSLSSLSHSFLLDFFYALLNFSIVPHSFLNLLNSFHMC